MDGGKEVTMEEEVRKIDQIYTSGGKYSHTSH